MDFRTNYPKLFNFVEKSADLRARADAKQRKGWNLFKSLEIDQEYRNFLCIQFFMVYYDMLIDSFIEELKSLSDALLAPRLVGLNLLEIPNKNDFPRLEEMKLLFDIPANQHITIELPIIETNPPDQYGYYVLWRDTNSNSIKRTHNNRTNIYEPHSVSRKIEVSLFGFGIKRFGLGLFKWTGRERLIEVLSFGEMGHNYTGLDGAFTMDVFDDQPNRLKKIPSKLPSSVNSISHMFSFCKNTGYKLFGIFWRRRFKR